MNNDELNRLLRSAETPKRDATYWEEFTNRITLEIRREKYLDFKTEKPTAKLRLWFVGVGLVTASVALAFLAGFWRGQNSNPQVIQTVGIQKYLQEIEAMFPNQLQAIIWDKKGAHLILSETANVPNSTPLLVTIYNGQKSKSILTFSGQEIQVNGEKCEVLLDGKQNVLLVGEHRIWSSDGVQNGKNVWIEAKAMGQL